MNPLRAILAFGLLAASLTLGGCIGFTPLYAAEGVTPKLQAIEVAQPSGRLGFLMHDFLSDSLARDRDQPAVYRLTFVNSEVRSPQGITISNVASRYEVDLNTSYALTEIATGKVITRGLVAVNVTYDVQAQPYAALSEAQDGERRAAEQAADRLRLELATFFASPRPVPAASTLIPPPVSAYSERMAGTVIQSPREQATGELRPQDSLNGVFGQVQSTTVTPEAAQPFSPSQDPNNIQTPPTTDGSTGQQ
jgi:LPS-assembly lipoprotein